MTKPLLKSLHLESNNAGAYAGEFIKCKGEMICSISPIDGSRIATVDGAERSEYDQVIDRASSAFEKWRRWPAPARGEVIRKLGEELRRHKDPLAQLVTVETGKLLAESLGEVQEMIDICDFAVGMSRQLYGLSMHSERPNHRMYEQWHPLGLVGVISAFNFPVAVWAWNATIAAICGNCVIWKPSPKTPLTALAVQHIVSTVLRGSNAPDVFSLLIGSIEDVGTPLVEDRRLPLISATGSTPMGRQVATIVAARLGRFLLELGGNNAVIVTEQANIDLAVRAILFGAVGTAGQRCTTTRRLLLQRSISREVLTRLKRAYEQIRIGNPLHPDTLMGPLVDASAAEQHTSVVDQAISLGGDLVTGEGKRLSGMPSDCYVKPTILRVNSIFPLAQEEAFCPILYVMEADTVEDLVALQNAVPQGLSSAIFTENLPQAEFFLSARGSDCGIANVNLGTSGAEIGGAFGGEKDTGGGREAGSDAWKSYMRRQTVTINYGRDLPLAQGIHFGD